MITLKVNFNKGGETMQGMKEFRESLNLTQLEMSETLGISHSYYTKIEMGQKTPSYNFIRKFRKIYQQFDIENFFEDRKHN